MLRSQTHLANQLSAPDTKATCRRKAEGTEAESVVLTLTLSKLLLLWGPTLLLWKVQDTLRRLLDALSSRTFLALPGTSLTLSRASRGSQECPGRSRKRLDGRQDDPTRLLANFQMKVLVSSWIDPFGPGPFQSRSGPDASAFWRLRQHLFCFGIRGSAPDDQSGLQINTNSSQSAEIPIC